MHPDDLNEVDRQIQLNKLHHEVEDHTASDQEPQWLEPEADNYLDYLSAWEEGQFGVRPADLLEKRGISLMPPDELDEATISAKLDEVIQGLARIGAFLHNTKHLTDAELYRQLWDRMLFEETLLMPQNAAFAYHWDPLGGCSDEEIRTGLAYDTDAKRTEWMQDFPGYDLPPKLPPKSLRDETLPQRPLPPPEEVE